MEKEAHDDGRRLLWRLVSKGGKNIAPGTAHAHEHHSARVIGSGGGVDHRAQQKRSILARHSERGASDAIGAHRTATALPLTNERASKLGSMELVKRPLHIIQHTTVCESQEAAATGAWMSGPEFHFRKRQCQAQRNPCRTVPQQAAGLVTVRPGTPRPRIRRWWVPRRTCSLTSTACGRVLSGRGQRVRSRGGHYSRRECSCCRRRRCAQEEVIKNASARPAAKRTRR